MRRPIWLLALGCIAGLGLSVHGLLRAGASGDSGLPEHAVARVGPTHIRAEHYTRLLRALESDLSRPARDTERVRVLDRMIEEELLVQRGLELGLARHDRRVRADLVSAMIAAVTTEAEERQPDEAELRAFFADERDFFTQPGRLHVRQVYVSASSGGDGPARARAAHARLQGGDDFEAVRQELGDIEVARVPAVLLPPVKLREYLGPTALRAAMELRPGGVSEPVRGAGGWHVIQLVEAEGPRVPAFEAVQPQVRAEWIRRAGDRALREYLDDLRGRADMEVRTELPD